MCSFTVGRHCWCVPMTYTRCISRIKLHITASRKVDWSTCIDLWYRRSGTFLVEYTWLRIPPYTGVWFFLVLTAKQAQGEQEHQWHE